MKTSQYKARILFLGPCNAGKTRLANYLADISIELPDELRPTKGLRIVEYDLNGVAIDGANSNVDVQIWDTSGDEKYMAYWSVFRKNVDGVVFVYDQEDDIGVRKLDHMYNYFVSQPNLSLRTCLVCSVQAEEVNAKLSPAFSKISQITVNIDSQGEKFKQDFTKYVQSVVIVYAYVIVYLAIPAEITFDTTNKVGGLNDDHTSRIVEIDESKFFQRKYHRGQWRGHWFFGAIERGTGKCFLIDVANRREETLIEIIRTN